MAIHLSDKHNLTATTAPGATDDHASGYHERSRWINTLTGIEYVCIDATTGAARWQVNEYAGLASVAGLNAALGAAAESATRMGISEDFTKLPKLASEVTTVTLATVSAQRSGYMFLLNPAAANTTGGADQLDVSGGGGAMANIVQPDVPRNIVINFTDGDASISAFQVDVVGVAPDGSATAEQFLFAGGLDQVGSVIHAKITSVTVTSITGNGAGDTLDIGYGVKLGVNLPAGSTSLSILKLKAAGTEEAAGATDTTNNSFTATTAPDGAVDYEVWYEYADINIANLRANQILIAALLNAVALGNPDFELFGTNMTSALATLDAARGGFRLTTAGGNNDQAGVQPRQTNANDSRWAKGFVTDQSPKWGRSFRLTSVAAIQIGVGLSLTNAQDLTTDADQVKLWFTTATGGNFLIAYSIGGTDATIDTGVTPAAGTEYSVLFDIQADRTCVVTLNGVEVGRTPALTTAVNLKPYGCLQALTASAKSWDIRDKDFASMEQAA